MTDSQTPSQEAQNRELLRLVDQALEEPASQQQAWLEAHCPDDLLDSAQRMLSAAQAVTGEFQTTFSLADSAANAAPLIGQQIGAYRLLELLGEGGMGQVYKAERADGTFAQTVAIKVIRAAFQSARGIAQFESERQILSDLTHPNIALLLDGGATADGSPYVVMEHVDGLPLDVYIARHKLPIRERLALFLKVCAAVAHAHSALVIHRDIKPSNILVDSNGEPKLLDFGIAKTLDGTERSSDRTVAMALTPAYASPEQVVGDSLTTATDIYSLGVVLYQCLTGERPFDTDQLSPARYEAMITEQRPDAPSVRLQALKNLSADQVRGDLDAIVLCALAKEPQRRYGTVAAFAEDVERYLGGFPVEAREDRLGYRLRKFVGRRKGLVAGTSAALLALVVAYAVTVVQYQIATAERERADRRFDQARELARKVMFDVYDQMDLVQGTLPARERLAAVGVEYLDELAADPHAPDDILLDLGVQYTRLSDLYGGLGVANFGDTKTSRELLLKAESALAELLDRDPGNAAAAQEMIWVKRLLTNQQLHYDMNTDAARNTAESGLALASTFEQAAAQPDWSLQRRKWNLRGDLLKVLIWENKYDEALERLNRYLVEIEAPEIRENLRDQPSKRAYLLGLRGELYGDSGQTEAAIADYEKVLAHYQDRIEAQPGNTQLLTQLMRFRLGLSKMYQRRQDWPEALESANAAVAAATQLVDADPRDLGSRRNLASVQQALAKSLAGAGEAQRGAEVIATSIVTYRELIKADAENGSLIRDLASALLDAGDLALDRSEKDIACRSYRDSQQQWQAVEAAGELTPYDRETGLTRVQKVLAEACA